MEGLEGLLKIINDCLSGLASIKIGFCDEIYDSERIKIVLETGCALAEIEAKNYLKNTNPPNYQKLLFLLEDFLHGEAGIAWEEGYEWCGSGMGLECLIDEIRHHYEKFSSPKELEQSVQFLQQIDARVAEEGIRKHDEEFKEAREQEKKEAQDQLDLEQSEKIYYAILAENGDERRAYQASQDFLIDNGLQRSDDCLEKEDD